MILEWIIFNTTNNIKKEIPFYLNKISKRTKLPPRTKGLMAFT